MALILAETSVVKSRLSVPHGSNLYLLYLLCPGMGERYCDQHVCMSVCLSACISQKPHFHISPNFLHMLPVAMARSSYDGFAIG